MKFKKAILAIALVATTMFSTVPAMASFGLSPLGYLEEQSSVDPTTKHKATAYTWSQVYISNRLSVRDYNVQVNTGYMASYSCYADGMSAHFNGTWRLASETDDINNIRHYY